MCNLWCFSSEPANRRSKKQRNGCEREPRQSPSRVDFFTPIAKSACRAQPLSHTPPRNPTARLPQTAAGPSLFSSSSSSSVRSIALRSPFPSGRFTPANTGRTTHSHRRTPIADTRPSSSVCTPTSVSRQDPEVHKVQGIFDPPRSCASNMPQPRVRKAVPQGREDSPTLPEDRARSRLTFYGRMARLSAVSPPSSAAERSMLLDNNSISSYGDGGEGQCDNNGRVSDFGTPKRNAAHSSCRPHFSPHPLFFSTQLFTPTVEASASQKSALHADAPLCDHRHCLRHKQTCLEHTRTPAPTTQASRHPLPQIRGTRQVHWTRTGQSQRFDPDVWIQIAAEYRRGF